MILMRKTIHVCVYVCVCVCTIGSYIMTTQRYQVLMHCTCEHYFIYKVTFLQIWLKQDFEKRFSWIIWVGYKRHHKYPYKIEEEIEMRSPGQRNATRSQKKQGTDSSPEPPDSDTLNSCDTKFRLLASRTTKEKVCCFKSPKFIVICYSDHRELRHVVKCINRKFTEGK